MTTWFAVVCWSKYWLGSRTLEVAKSFRMRSANAKNKLRAMLSNLAQALNAWSHALWTQWRRLKEVSASVCWERCRGCTRWSGSEAR